MDVISIVIPRLDLMAQTSWLVYGVAGSGGISFVEGAGAYAHALMATIGLPGFILLQGIFSAGLLLFAAAFDFLRREF